MMKPTAYFFSLVTACSLSLHALSAAPVSETRTALQEWVETRQIISQEKADWELLRETLIDTEELLTKQNEQLDAKLEELRESQSAADEEREQLMAENAELKLSTESLGVEVAAVEARLLAVLPLLPEALTDKIDPLIRRIPEPGKETRAGLGERVQNIVGILSQADAFNNKMHVVNRTQELADGREVQVSTLFLGLGQAYFVDTTGSYAGVGTPAEDGWVYESVEGLAPQVQELLAAYSGEATEIDFIAVPARIQ